MQNQQDQHIRIMAEQEAKLRSRYGALSAISKTPLGHGHQRKYFDSGDYALSKAGKEATVGSEHPQPEDIPHSIPVDPVYGSIPTRRGSLINMTIQPNNTAEQQAL
ncbi:hypothetical protein BX616_004909 [Lobosporangium transversale]|uniref:mRNA stability protein n=1 Tax=Lobosporangium transversale TaxID=64571 RepID=A0A1Y2GI62_9FUNG|nr:hypothetical protein BCR41DRAFT_424086 [Lobosporangium transversale]KAF9915990.1 hypothetical protein BX616_004909 [Lobosporangium transversale]ORZ09745.1 hypothetical protein BCR41DRAFT_424086 [Lobosporangium transversale]|eukprot:XP_021879015.1 hypothetical protein BCR41DRAFT_424086 [Lobosporangium transversale]